MLGITGCKHKKDLKALVGKEIVPYIVETSMFGAEFKSNLSGTSVVGPDAYNNRKWYAQIWVKNGILTKVK